MVNSSQDKMEEAIASFEAELECLVNCATAASLKERSRDGNL